MSDNNRQQAYVPQGAIAIENPVGTAPVFIVDDGQNIVVVLPGVPREMKHLLEHAIIPWLKDRLDLQGIIKARVLRTAGIGESQIDHRLRDLMNGANPTIGLAAHTGQTDVRVTAKAASEAEADALIAPLEAEIRKRLGDVIYGTGDLPLEDALVALCREASVSLSSCEAGTGEKLAARLDAAAQGSEVCAGGLSMPDDTALAGELALDASLPVAQFAEAAASACRLRYDSSLGIAVVVRRVQDGDPKGQSGTAVAVSTADGAHSRYYAFGTERQNAPIWATTHALAMARRAVMEGKP
jgi:nicotinamide mononucleotide (NMN) deamidase PncC